MPTVLERIRMAFGAGETWPPRALRYVWDEVELHAAFRTSNEERLRMEASVPFRSPYLVTPVPRLISRASTNLLFGEPPTITPANEADAQRLEDLVENNGLEAELQRAGVVSSSEGEVWGRVLVQPDLLDWPIIEFVSRSRVIPHFSGRFLIAVTFVTTWATGNTERWRLLETYEAGLVGNTLFRGTRNNLGTEMALDSFGPTSGMVPEVFTGIERPLAAFIPNSIDADPCRGFSDYHGLEQRFLAINESETVGHQNLRLAGRKRALVDGDYLNDNGKLEAHDDVLVRTAKDATMGDKAKPLELLEYSFEAAAVVSWTDHLLDTSLLLAGIAPQAVGRAVEGGALSGTALKLKMAHSLIEAAGKGRHYDRGLKWLLRAAGIIDSRPTTQGGFGRQWQEPDTNPTVERADGLPRDDLEAATILTALVNAEAISLEERVRWAHPDWSQDRVEEEVTAIEEEAGSSAPMPPAGIPTPRPALELGAGPQPPVPPAEPPPGA